MGPSDYSVHLANERQLGNPGTGHQERAEHERVGTQEVKQTGAACNQVVDGFMEKYRS